MGNKGNPKKGAALNSDSEEERQRQAQLAQLQMMVRSSPPLPPDVANATSAISETPDQTRSVPTIIARIRVRRISDVSSASDAIALARLRPSMPRSSRW